VVRALELDPNVVDAHATFGIIHYFYDWDYAAGRREFDAALAADPDHVEAAQWKGFCLGQIEGDFDQAVALCRRAATLDPLSGVGAMHLANVLLCAGRHAESDTAARTAIEREPALWMAGLILGTSQLGQGRSADALTILTTTLTVSNRHPWVMAMLVEGLVRAREPDRAHTLYQELLDRSRTPLGPKPGILAIAAASLGRTEDAFQWLDRAIEERDAVPTMGHSWLSEPIRRTPQFGAVMRRIGLIPNT
jgi:pentatricopeptide repeat protein